MRKRSLLPGLAMIWVLGGAMAGWQRARRHRRFVRMAATPPMGWNSWDGYGTTVKEADVKANAQWMAAHLKVFRLAVCRGGHGVVRHQSNAGRKLQEFRTTASTTPGATRRR